MAKAAEAKANTFRAVCEKYMELAGRKLRSAHQRKRILERLVYPELGERPIDGIKRKTDIVRLLDKIETENGARMAHETLAVIRKIFNWHATRTDDFHSPIVRGMGRVNAKERARSRTLNDDELCAVWKTAEKDAGPFGAFVRFLLLTAARRNEAAAMRWCEVGPEGWTLPASRNKVKVDLLRPLSAPARRIVEEQPRIGESAFVFSRGGRSALSGISTLKEEFDDECGVTGWRLHDLRRTARSLMSRAKVNADNAERCLGHVIGGVRGTYDRHEYKEEKLQAYEALGSLIERIVHPQQNVVPLRGGEAG